MNKRKIALAGMAFAVIGVLAALGAWALPETATADGGNSITSPDTTGSAGYHTSLELDANGFPVVIYTASSGGHLNVMHCNGADCQGGEESTADGETDDGGGGRRAGCGGQSGRGEARQALHDDPPCGGMPNQLHEVGILLRRVVVVNSYLVWGRRNTA